MFLVLPILEGNKCFLNHVHCSGAGVCLTVQETFFKEEMDSKDQGMKKNLTTKTKANPE